MSKGMKTKNRKRRCIDVTNQVKDTRLWDKSDGIIPFVTRSQKLAVDLMKAVGMKDSIIKSYRFRPKWSFGLPCSALIFCGREEN
jgi:hypothetical protein